MHTKALIIKHIPQKETYYNLLMYIVKNLEFKIENNQYQLNYQDSSKFISLILSEIATYKKYIFRYIQQYYRWFMKNKNLIDFPMAELINDNN